MVKNILMSFWFWGLLLASFIAIILWDEKIEEGVKAAYVKHRMMLRDVNFSQVEGGFEHARMFADLCEMDDNQNNIDATNIRTIFYKQDVATWSGWLEEDIRQGKAIDLLARVRPTLSAESLVLNCAIVQLAGRSLSPSARSAMQLFRKHTRPVDE